MKGISEKTVGELHNVSFVNAGDLLALVGQSKAEGKFGNALRLGPCDNLERFDNASNRLVLKTGVFAFRILTNDAEVYIVMLRLVTWYVLDENNRCVNV